MATQVQKIENRFPQRILQADGICELILGAGLILESQTLASWLGINAIALEVGGVIVLAFGAWLLYISQRNASRQVLQVIAVLNIACVALVGLLLVLDWNTLANEGRWALEFASDVFLMLGIVEFYARRFVVSL